MQTLSIIPPLAMMAPALSALITERAFKDFTPFFNLNLKLNKFFLFSWLTPVVLALLTLFIGATFPEVFLEYNPEALPHRLGPWLSSQEVSQLTYFYETNPLSPIVILFNGLLSGLLVSTILAYGEERGWRGFLLKELAPLGFWKSSLLLGFIWGLWHFPLIIKGYNFPDHPYEGVLLMGLSCALLSPIMCYLTEKSGHVLSAAIFHGAMNGVFGLSVVFLKGGNDLLIGPFALSGILSLIILNLLLTQRAHRKHRRLCLRCRTTLQSDFHVNYLTVLLLRT